MHDAELRARPFDLPAEAASERAPDLAMPRRAILAATVGNILEWYDFIVFGFLTLTISKVFFPTGDPLASLLLTLGTFGAGIVMRPVGALVLGAYADRAGRKAALMLTIVSMAFGTALIGLAPGYAAIGLWAPVVVVVGRLIQGFSAGGELGAATSMLLEYAPPGRRGFYGSWQQVSQAAAFLLGAAVNGLVAAFVSPEALQAGGWRIPLLLGLLIAPVGLYIRASIDETPAFLAQRRTHGSAPAPLAPLAHALGQGLPALLTAMGIAVLYGVSMYLLLLYMPTYAVRQLGLSASDSLFASSVAGVILCLMSPVIGAVSDRVGRRVPMLASAACFVVLTYPAFMLLAGMPGLGMLIAVQGLFALMISAYTGPAIAAFGELFPTGMRSTGVALAYNLTIAGVGGFAPVIVTWLIARTGNGLMPAIYVTAAALVSGLVVWRMRDRYLETI